MLHLVKMLFFIPITPFIESDMNNAHPHLKAFNHDIVDPDHPLYPYTISHINQPDKQREYMRNRL